MKKPFKYTLLLSIIVTLVAWMLYYDSTTLAPSRFSVRYESIYSDKIPSQLNEKTILFFSDIHYNAFMDDVRLETAITLINQLSPDIIVFLGDLLDSPSSTSISEEVLSNLEQQLSKLHAPLGKFAVLGDHDLENFSSKELVTSLLKKSNFEIITNQSIYLRNQGSQSINLVGLDSQLLGEPDITTPFTSVSPESFTIVVSHTPDIILELPSDLVDLQVSGHSHGGQVFLPLFGSQYRVPYAEVYSRGKSYVGETRLDITNGIGTSQFDARFLANAEVVLYTLHSKSAPTTPLESTPLPQIDDIPREENHPTELPTQGN